MIKIGGSEPTNISFNGSDADYATLNGTVVWERVSGVNGTASYGGWTDYGSSYGGAISYTYGSFGSWGPTSGTGATNQSTVTITQSRSRATTKNTAAVFINQRRLCELVTSPTGGGSAGTCSSPFNVIGDYDSSGSRTVSNSSFTSVTPTTGNGGLQTRSQSVTNTAYKHWPSGAYWNQGTISITSGGTVTVPGSPGTAVVTSQSPSGANTGSSTRTVTIQYTVANPSTSTYGGGSYNSGSLNLTQPVHPATTASFTTGTLSLSNAANSGTFGFTVNGSWNTIGTGGMSATHSGSGNRTAISWSIPANTGPARSGTIVIRSGSSGTIIATLNWSQAAVTPPSGTISTGVSSVSFIGQPTSGQTVTVTTTPTNGTFSVTDNQSWITATKSGNNVSISVTDNHGAFATFRSGTVTVTHNNGSPSDTITVNQDASGGGGF